MTWKVTGPLSVHFWGEIDQKDTNWIIIIKDVGPDVSVQTAREGEMERPQVPEREITRGWLKASHRAIDEQKSEPGRPFHPLTRSAQKPVAPGEINRYDVEIAPTSNVFRTDHRICVDITSLDVPTVWLVIVPWNIFPITFARARRLFTRSIGANNIRRIFYCPS